MHAARLSAGALVFLLSLIVGPYYVNGDQSVYRKVYDALPELSVTEGYRYYSLTLSSEEVVHFSACWLASRVMEKDLFVALSNAVLAYASMALFKKWKASAVLSVLLLLTNFYFLVLYFAAERLKFGFIFLILMLVNQDSVRRSWGFAALATVSHVQVIVIFISMLIDYCGRHVRRILLVMKRPVAVSLFVAVVAGIVWLVGNQVMSKVPAYYGKGSIVGLLRIAIFFSMALWYARSKRQAVFLFVPVVIATFAVGGERMNMIGYCLFLYFGLQYRGGWNVGVVATSAYFAYSSIGFLENVFRYGDGFFLG